MMTFGDTMRSGRSVGAALLAAGLVVAGVSATEAALTTQSCMAKKPKEWGRLRSCQAAENAKALQGTPAHLGHCKTKFDAKLAKLTTRASAAAIECRYRVNTGAERGTVTDYDTATSDSYACAIMFGEGSANGYRRDLRLYVRAVRSVL